MCPRSRKASRTLPPTSRQSCPASTSRRASCCTGASGASSGRSRAGTFVIGHILAGHESAVRSNPSATVQLWGCGARESDAVPTPVATFCFDARATLVWVDTLDPDRGTGAGVLCVHHADALTPPRGWHLQDRRTGRPRLWEDRPALPRDRRRQPSTAETGSTGADVRTSPGPGVAADPLPFDDARSVPGADLDGLDDLDDFLDPRSPLLARAFAGLRPR